MTEPARIHSAEDAGAGGSAFPECDHEFNDAVDYEHDHEETPISMNAFTDGISFRVYRIHRVLEECSKCGWTEWTDWEICDCEF